MYKIKFLFLSLILCLICSGCTDNTRAKSFGGTMRIELPKGQHLVNCTWKESNLWYLTRPLHQDEEPVTSTFKEESSVGMLSGTVLFVESK